MFPGKHQYKRTLLQLCRSASARWPFENRLPVDDLPSILRVASSPAHYMHRMVRFDLVGGCLPAKPWRMN